MHSFNATIELPDSTKKLNQVISADLKNSNKNDRASAEIKQKEGGVIINIKAKDFTALRASLNSITKIVAVFEKAKKII